MYSMQNGLGYGDFNPVTELQRARAENGELRQKIMDAHKEHQAQIQAELKHADELAGMSDDEVRPPWLVKQCAHGRQYLSIFLCNGMLWKLLYVH